MKTFRLKGLELVFLKDESPVHESISYKEGLVINREEGTGWWLVDAVISPKYRERFNTLLESQEPFVMEVTITDENNDPATMIGHVREIHELSEELGVLFDAKMAIQQEDVFNFILETLIADGYSGDALLEEFKNRKENQGSWSEQVAKKLYSEVKRESYKK
ncbi:YwpF family protein [Salsuginibacillus kocurii]|uniref:YwpF family protein n=1 Tax=Salsuginibacillus kocurii TaxID=427078 RepID=UPI000382B179|nr:YwpF family protein [Salsuginibacillus kocurii]